MTQAGVYSPADARMVLEVVRYLRDNGFVIPGGRKPEQVLQPDRVYFRNDSGAEVPAWGCMEVTGTVEAGGQNYVKITKPTTGGVSFLFNGQAPVADGKYGTAQSGPVFRVYKSTGTATEGHSWGPTVGQWYLTQHTGPYIVYGADDIGSNVFRVVTNNRLIHVKTKATCAARDNTTGAMTSVSCDRYNVLTDGTVSDANYDITVWNPGGAIASGAWGTVLLNEAGLYEFVVVKCV